MALRRVWLVARHRRAVQTARCYPAGLASTHSGNARSAHAAASRTNTCSATRRPGLINASASIGHYPRMGHYHPALADASLSQLTLNPNLSFSILLHNQDYSKWLIEFN